MFDRENAVGLLLLGLCAAAGAVLVFATVTGTELRYTGPGWLAWVIGIVFIGSTLWLMFSSVRRWPDPLTGRGRRWWSRWRGRDGGDGR